jgi:hypothetical protein
MLLGQWTSGGTVADRSTNKQGIAALAEEIHAAFAEHPISTPLDADSSGVVMPGTTPHYDGPLVRVDGDDVALVWDNPTAEHGQASVDPIAPGYETLAEALVRVLQSAGSLALSREDTAQVELTTNEVLVEVTKTEPNLGLVKSGVNIVKGLMSGTALGLTEGVPQESRDLAVQVIDQIQQES